MTGEQRRNLICGLAFTSPWIVGFIVFTGIPLAMSLYFSFCDYSILNPPAFIGLRNYGDIASDEVFWKSLANTLVFLLISLPIGTAIALLLALLLNTNIAGRSIYRTIFFIPSLVPLVALGILWKESLHVQYGSVNVMLRGLGLPGSDWLGEPSTAKLGIALSGFWGIGNAVVIYLASLQDVPASLYEAAEVDGASHFQRFLHVTVPSIAPVIYFNVMMGTIGLMQVFALPYVMTGGGPARSTYFYTMYLFDQAFGYLNMGYASALAWVMFLIIAALSWLGSLASRRYSAGENA